MPQKKKNGELVNRLAEWLKKHSAVKMASLLGYGSSAAVTGWVVRKSIPDKAAQKVRDVLNKKSLKPAAKKKEEAPHVNAG